jgi:hypothetical protein
MSPARYYIKALFQLFYHVEAPLNVFLRNNISCTDQLIILESRMQADAPTDLARAHTHTSTGI